MYLKKLEIHGFKSFADKTSLEFKPGITAVVGPNGSGKSNIADAIRWVLGEQSVKSLRGGKMEDVIFAGSEKRRSLGMAEVSLTIDNSKGIFPLEFNEVTVTRRLYRSGESDYLINRVPCRLKDIYELFMDTGAGREGISIIGQGKVDEILAVKPEERRGLIEEAAGIVKYRYRKREAQKKLEDTENNLLRLRDIVYELSSQEGPLEEQAKDALRYKELRAENDELEIGLILEEAESMKDKLKNIDNNRSKVESESEQLRTNYHGLRSKEEELRLKLQKTEEKLAGLQEGIYAKNLQLEKKENEKKLTTERISDLDKQRKSMGHDLRQLQEELNGLKKEFEDHQTKGEGLLASVHEKKAKLQEFENHVAKENIRGRERNEKLEELKTEHFETLQEETRIKNELTALQQRLDLLVKQEKDVDDRKKDAASKVEVDTIKLKELEKEAREHTRQRQGYEQELSGLHEFIGTQGKKYQELKKQGQGLGEERNSLAARQKILQEMEREGQGYGVGVKEILRHKQAGGFPGIIGSVAQLVSVPGKYELAVEIVLGNALQNLVTVDEEAAQEAIGWLKKNNKGRVTFLPITTVKGRPAIDNVPSGKGVYGRLSELVEFAKEYQGIMEYLLGRVWLVDDLQTAVAAAKKTGFRYRIVTLDGQLVNAGGSLTGGSVKPSSGGILSRKRSVQELEKTLSDLEGRLSILKKEEEELLTGVTELRQKEQEIKEKLQEVIIKEAENIKIQERWQAEKERSLLEHDNISLQLAEMISEKSVTQKGITEAEKAVAAFLGKVDSMEQVIKELQEKIRTNQTEILKKNEKLTQLRIDVATDEEKYTAFKKESSYLEQRIRQLSQHREAKEAERNSLKEDTKRLEEAFQAFEVEKKGILKELQALEKQLEKTKGEKNELTVLIGSTDEEAREVEKLLRAKEERLHQYDIQQSKFETSLEGLIDKLFEQHGMSLEQAAEKGIVCEDRKLAQQRIEEIRAEITGLGEVNIAAIEEHRRLVERLEFLNQQIQDLTEAGEKLHEVIKEMEKIMKKRFEETYYLVNQAFQEMFTKLFGGGRAELVLTNSENLLETGVDIIAQPPGKKTQHLSLLSGGEKSLTAIALLLAILKVKPSPFCVLDEIESNLDEMNVVNFAEALKAFAEETQFIVISHQKGTMEKAHVLYGVTIEEDGVSRMVSVRLKDIEKEAS